MKTSHRVTLAIGVPLLIFLTPLILAILVPDLVRQAPVEKPVTQKAAATPAPDPDRDIALVAVMTIKQSQRNPDSFALEDAFITSSAVCLTYRGQNGFGGMSRGQAVVARDFKFAFADHESGFVRAWNKGCAKQRGRDMTESMKLNLRYNPAMK